MIIDRNNKLGKKKGIECMAITAEKREKIRFFIRTEMEKTENVFPRRQVDFTDQIANKFGCKGGEVLDVILKDKHLNDLVKSRTNWRKYLRDYEVTQIRKRAKNGESVKSLAKEFGVTEKTIQNKLRGMRMCSTIRSRDELISAVENLIGNLALATDINSFPKNKNQFFIIAAKKLGYKSTTTIHNIVQTTPNLLELLERTIEARIAIGSTFNTISREKIVEEEVPVKKQSEENTSNKTIVEFVPWDMEGKIWDPRSMIPIKNIYDHLTRSAFCAVDKIVKQMVVKSSADREVAKKLMDWFLDLACCLENKINMK